MTKLLLDHGASVDSVVVGGLSQLMEPILDHAINCKQDKTALLIIQRGATITGRNRGIILRAINYSCVRTLRCLVSMFPEEAAATTRDGGLLAPLAYGVRSRKFDCCKVLINGGAKLSETYLNERGGGFIDTTARDWDLLTRELQEEPGKWPSVYPN